MLLITPPHDCYGAAAMLPPAAFRAAVTMPLLPRHEEARYALMPDSASRLMLRR